MMFRRSVEGNQVIEIFHLVWRNDVWKVCLEKSGYWKIPTSLAQ